MIKLTTLAVLTGIGALMLGRWIELQGGHLIYNVLGP